MNFMDIIRIWAAMALICLPLSCGLHEIETASPDEMDEGREIQAIREHSYVQGVSVVEFSEGFTARIESEGPGFLAEWGILGAERVFAPAGEYEALAREQGLHRFYRVSFAKIMPVTKALSSLGETDGIVSVEPVRRVRRRSFNDPLLGRQWNLVGGSRAVDINVSYIWDNYTTGSSDVIVAVMDETVDSSHPDLAANMWDDGSGRHGYNFVKSTFGQTLDSRYDTGHGTHVAGVVSAVNNNGIGVSGIAGGDAAAGVAGVRIMSCQIFDGKDSATDDQCAEAIRWSASQGAVISQNSWGYYADEDEDGEVSPAELAAYKMESIPIVLKRAVEYFNTYAGCDAGGKQRAGSPMKGGLVFFAAGNEDIDYDPICSDNSVIAVAATGATGGKASYSNYGPWVDLCAPGGDGSYDIWSTVPTFESASGYAGKDWQGTSMACPHASGAAALAVSYFGGQGLTAAKLRTALEKSGTAAGGSSAPIGRRIDVAALFSELGNHPPVVSSKPDNFKYTVVNTRTSKDLSDIFEDEDGDELKYSAESSDEGVVKVSVSGDRLYLEPVSYGQATITVSATDGVSPSVSTSFIMVIWDDSQGFSANAIVSDGSLDIRIASEDYQDVHIEVFSATGARVFDTRKVISIFDPATIHVPGIAPGVYALRISYGGHSYTKTFVKS